MCPRPVLPSTEHKGRPRENGDCWRLAIRTAAFAADTAVKIYLVLMSTPPRLSSTYIHGQLFENNILCHIHRQNKRLPKKNTPACGYLARLCIKRARYVCIQSEKTPQDYNIYKHIEKILHLSGWRRFAPCFIMSCYAIPLASVCRCPVQGRELGGLPCLWHSSPKLAVLAAVAASHALILVAVDGWMDGWMCVRARMNEN